MDKIKKYKFIVVAIVLATMAIAPLTGCKIIKDAIGLADKEKSVEEPEIADPRKVESKRKPDENHWLFRDVLYCLAYCLDVRRVGRFYKEK